MDEQLETQEQPIAGTEIAAPEYDADQGPAPASAEEPIEAGKFKSLEDKAKAYDEAEKALRQAQREKAELAKQAQEAELLRQRVFAYENVIGNQPVQSTQVNDADEFVRTWEEDPRRATYEKLNQIEQRTQMVAQQNALNVAYAAATNDSVNFPNFKKYEPTMAKAALAYRELVRPDKINDPRLISLLYSVARSAHLSEELEAAKKQAVQEFETSRSKKESAFSEGASPVGASSSSRKPEDMSLEEMEKILGFAKS